MNKKNFVNKVVLPVTLAIVAAVVPFVLIQINLLDGYSAQILIMCAINAIMALSVNIICGITGQLSLGQAGFMALGGYATILLTDMAHLPLPVSIILAALITAFFGFLIGFPTLRLEGDYLAIVTLAFGEIVKNIVNVLYIAKDTDGTKVALIEAKDIKLSEEGFWVINGAKGIAKIPHLSSFTAGIILILLVLVIVFHLVNSRTGRAIMAIRDNRIAAESVGIDITKFKMLAFVISAAIAGAGGVLYAHNLSTVTATTANFGYNMSIMILVFVVLGGMGSFRGSIIAACVLTLLPEVLRGMKDYRMLIYSIVLIAMMLFNWAPKAIEMRQKFAAKFMNSKKKTQEE